MLAWLVLAWLVLAWLVLAWLVLAGLVLSRLPARSIDATQVMPRPANSLGAATALQSRAVATAL